MLTRRHHISGNWSVVKADIKQTARLNVIKDMLFRIEYKGKNHELILPDANVVFNYDESYLLNGMLAP